MSRLLPHFDAAMAIARRDLAVFASYRVSVITSNFGILFNLALFYYISRLVTVGQFDSPDAYYAFVVVGIIILGIVRSSLGMPGSMRGELVAGTFERVALSPFGGTSAIVSMFVFPFAYSLLVATLTLVIAASVFGVDIQWATVWLAVPLGFLGALAFAPFALLFAAITLVFKQAPGQTVILALISLLAGLYFPVALLPDWLRWLSEVQPFTPTVDVMRHVTVGLEMDGSPWTAVAKIAGFAIVLMPVAVWVLSEAGRIARRRGTITEY